MFMCECKGQKWISEMHFRLMDYNNAGSSDKVINADAFQRQKRYCFCQIHQNSPL